MFNISQFLEKFKNVGMAEVFLKQSVVDSVKKHTGVSFDLKDVQYKNAVITLPGNPSFRTTLYIKKSAILSDLKSAGGKYLVKDIR